MKTLSDREKKVANTALTGLALAGLTAWALGASILAILGLAFCGFILGGALAETILGRVEREAQRSDLGADAVTTGKTPAAASTISVLQNDDAQPQSMTTIDGQITIAAALADDPATVISLYKFRKERERLLDATLDDDLAAEVEVIASSHLHDLIAAYRGSRELTTGDAAAHIDRALIEAVDRLSARLREIAEAQAARSFTGLEMTERYLRNRHPVAKDDPFKS